MSQAGWQERATRIIAGQIRRYRIERGLSAQQLADECERLGFAVPRSVLANLENGRRETVSTAELQVLAKALCVAPLLLLFPLGVEPTVEVLPGKHVDPLDAIEWFEGIYGEPGDAGSPPQLGTDSPLILYLNHRDAVGRLYSATRWIADAWEQVAAADTPGEAERLRADIASAAAGMEIDARVTWSIRQSLRAMGMILPELPAELAHIDEKEPKRIIPSRYPPDVQARIAAGHADGSIREGDEEAGHGAR